MSLPKRICFDVESSLRKELWWGFLDSYEYALFCYREKYGPGGEVARFKCAVALSSTDPGLRSFLDVDSLISFLASADEIVTFNGKVYDLVVIALCGSDEQAIETILRKKHHDLYKWRGFNGLEERIRLVAGYERFDFHGAVAARASEIDSEMDRRSEGTLPKCQIDVECTWALFRQYIDSGDRSCTAESSLQDGLRS